VVLFYQDSSVKAAKITVDLLSPIACERFLIHRPTPNYSGLSQQNEIFVNRPEKAGESLRKLEKA
jgi:hypothetical protein